MIGPTFNEAANMWHDSEREIVSTDILRGVWSGRRSQKRQSVFGQSGLRDCGGHIAQACLVTHRITLPSTAYPYL